VSGSESFLPMRGEDDIDNDCVNTELCLYLYLIVEIEGLYFLFKNY
jgi:hypothetical protein